MERLKMRRVGIEVGERLDCVDRWGERKKGEVCTDYSTNCAMVYMRCICSDVTDDRYDHAQGVQ